VVLWIRDWASNPNFRSSNPPGYRRQQKFSEITFKRLGGRWQDREIEIDRAGGREKNALSFCIYSIKDFTFENSSLEISASNCFPLRP
jgi:hypothetical protein